MSDRLTMITTRGGDGGETSLGDGTRVPKHSLRIAALGEVDELNSQLGVVLTEALPAGVVDCLERVQHDLFDLGGELCIPGREAISDAQLGRLETAVETFNAALPSLAEFILPGGSRAAAQLHVARCVCRRAERTLVALDKEEVLAATGIKYLNRLSDLLFVLSRTANRHAGRGDVLWQPGLNR
ncbi:Cob(I)yrinic acid a,c-diamide adenosyltransferase [Andreprevotia sp. IGB-42]|uniref:cob(I)yrinic acid a,c-diamide adenosyltransferase n=1 Tax=Andreprevotia sp. IGB-42 TaxID=2497473 RepID=UPI00135BE9A0|nr:cob(I)yrinic acid a,c-diamide adenosyltransferase [Andreprevotia sp. IGB-42]KAF0814224.1 Cob(I)yrinic acid a,c-diamide adenosyltransferase [Andreprevotia sp. IGB-42]